VDYGRVYKQFIADRRAQEPKLTGYSERHHILPKCMGGNDEPHNLIRLTPEDHYFAHLLLAQAHGGLALWGACVLMARGAPSVMRARRTYGMVRRRWNEACRGLDAPNADLTVYTFFHESAAEFTGTRIGFGVHAKVPPNSINQLVRHRSRIVYGWAMDRSHFETAEADARARSIAAGKALAGFTRCPELFCFYHAESGRSIIATQKGMMALALLTRSGVSALCNGTRYVSSGWCLIESAGWAYERADKRGEFAASFDDTIHRFVNDLTGQTAVGTLYDMGLAYNGGDGRPFGDVVRGHRGGWRGWRIEGRKSPRVMNKTYSIRHERSGKAASGSMNELMGVIGVSKASVQHLVSEKRVMLRGWMLDGGEEEATFPR
jgi:hypothetical protein